MTGKQFSYDLMVQKALKSVVKEILLQVQSDGLQEDHHFYIAFRTTDEGVEIPGHLIESYPDEMTIVLQHRFWGLKVLEDRFEVGLSFNKKPEHLKIPFDAVIAFVDPSAQFALQFDGEADLESFGESFEADVTEPESTAPEAAVEQTEQDDPDAKVVALDSFRQK